MAGAYGRDATVTEEGTHLQLSVGPLTTSESDGNGARPPGQPVTRASHPQAI